MGKKTPERRDSTDDSANYFVQAPNGEHGDVDTGAAGHDAAV